jgi:hypothetical protein
MLGGGLIEEVLKQQLVTEETGDWPVYEILHVQPVSIRVSHTLLQGIKKRFKDPA